MQGRSSGEEISLLVGDAGRMKASCGMRARCSHVAYWRNSMRTVALPSKTLHTHLHVQWKMVFLHVEADIKELLRCLGLQ